MENDDALPLTMMRQRGVGESILHFSVCSTHWYAFHFIQPASHIHQYVRHHLTTLTLGETDILCLKGV